MNLTKQICHKAAHFDAVAFDVFDTLIKRDVAVPTGLFRLMATIFTLPVSGPSVRPAPPKAGR